MCDEFAHWPGNERIFAALEPTFSAPGCTSELLTTGVGPADWSSEYWRSCKDGDGLHTPFFTPATARPDRTSEWLTAKRRTMTKAAFRTEYALEESDHRATSSRSPDSGTSRFVGSATSIHESPSRPFSALLCSPVSGQGRCGRSPPEPMKTAAAVAGHRLPL